MWFKLQTIWFHYCKANINHWLIFSPSQSLLPAKSTTKWRRFTGPIYGKRSIAHDQATCFRCCSHGDGGSGSSVFDVTDSGGIIAIVYCCKSGKVCFLVRLFALEKLLASFRRPHRFTNPSRQRKYLYSSVFFARGAALSVGIDQSESRKWSCLERSPALVAVSGRREA